MTEIITHNGRSAVYLADHRGKRHLYLFRVEVDGTTTRYTFEKLGDVNDPQYVVTRRPGDWRCSCQAFTKSSRFRLEGCKHIQAAREAEAFLAALTPTKETANV